MLRWSVIISNPKLSLFLLKEKQPFITVDVSLLLTGFSQGLVPCSVLCDTKSNDACRARPQTKKKSFTVTSWIHYKWSDWPADCDKDNIRVFFCFFARGLPLLKTAHALKLSADSNVGETKTN